MTNLQKFHAKRCLTAVGFLVHQEKILLVKHKKLGIWLAPGGHVEEDELPHQTAEREFWEETGIKVRVIQTEPMLPSITSEYIPTPFFMNLHWISEENFKIRQKSKFPEERVTSEKWKKGCEQHYVLGYLVEPLHDVHFTQNVEETDGIGWFSLDEVMKLKTTENIKSEVEYAFRLKAKIEEIKAKDFQHVYK